MRLWLKPRTRLKNMVWLSFTMRIRLGCSMALLWYFLVIGTIAARSSLTSASVLSAHRHWKGTEAGAAPGVETGGGPVGGPAGGAGGGCWEVGLGLGLALALALAFALFLAAAFAAAAAWARSAVSPMPPPMMFAKPPRTLPVTRFPIPLRIVDAGWTIG